MTAREPGPGPSIGRLGFWTSLVLAMSGAVALSTFIQQSGAPSMFGLGRGAGHALVWGMALAIVWAAALRRLRDRGRSAIWMVPLVVGPLAAEALAGLLRSTPSPASLSNAASFTSLVLTVWALIELGVMPGLPRDADSAPTSSPPRRREVDEDTPPDSGEGADASVKTRSGRPRSAGRRGQATP